MSRWTVLAPLAVCALVNAPIACATSSSSQPGFASGDDGGPGATNGGSTADGGTGAGGDGASPSADAADTHDDGSTTGDDASSTGANDAGTTATTDAGPDASATGPAPFDVSWCPGAAITQQQVLAIFPPAATSATLATVTLAARQRNCQDQTGCQGWTPSTTLPLYAIQWNGNGFDFNGPTDITVPASGTAVCTVPGPNCTATVGPFTALVYSSTQQQVTAWGVSPDVNGAQAQVGNWSPDPSGDYLEWGQVTTTASCLWGTEDGRVYGASGTYVEYQLVLYATY